MTKRNQLCLFLQFKSNFTIFNKKGAVQILSYPCKAHMKHLTYYFSYIVYKVILCSLLDEH